MTKSKVKLSVFIDSFTFFISKSVPNSGIYDKNFSQQALDIESDIITMKTELSMEGSLDSPFEKLK